MKAIGALPNLIFYLQLHKVRHLYAPTFNHVFQNGNSANLVNLSLAGNKGIDDAFAHIIALQCPQIHVLTLAHVEGLTDKGLEIILTNCSSLHYLDIYSVKDITGSSFMCVPQDAQKLNFLVVEDFCDGEKEGNLNTLLQFNSKVRAHHTSTWKTGETYMCRLLQ